MDVELLGKEAVISMLGICERSLEKLVKEGRFPPPLRLGKTVRWLKSVVLAWLEAQTKAQRDWKPRSTPRRSALL